MVDFDCSCFWYHFLLSRLAGGTFVFSFQPFGRWTEKARSLLASLDNEKVVDFYFGKLNRFCCSDCSWSFAFSFRPFGRCSENASSGLHESLQGKTWKLSSKLRWIKKFLQLIVCILRLIVIRHPMPNVFAIILFRKQFHTNSLDFAFWSFVVFFGVQMRCLALMLVFGGSCERFVWWGTCE